MATHADFDAKTALDGLEHEPGYDAWKLAKIECGLTQSRDRSAMIPVDKIWHDLSLDR